MHNHDVPAVQNLKEFLGHGESQYSDKEDKQKKALVCLGCAVRSLSQGRSSSSLDSIVRERATEILHGKASRGFLSRVRDWRKSLPKAACQLPSWSHVLRIVLFRLNVLAKTVRT